MEHEEDPSSRPFIIFQIGTFYHRMWRECDIIFKEREFPLAMDQIPVLMTLYYSFPKGASQQEICVKLLRDKASVNRTVSFLLKQGIVNVVQDAANKRKTRVELTDTGKKLARQANTILKKFDGFLSSLLTMEESVQFQKIMDKLIGIITSL